MAGYNGNKVIKRNIRTGEIVMIYPSVKVAAAVEGVAVETIRCWCKGRTRLGDGQHRYEYKAPEKKQDRMALEAVRNSNQTICWGCDNACGGCSWSREFKPVEGWTATRRDLLMTNGTKESYIVHECPEFVPDPPLEERKKKWSEWI